MLTVENLHAYYGKSHILQGVSFHIGEGEIVSLLGRNGVGRATTIRSHSAANAWSNSGRRCGNSPAPSTSP